MREQHHSPSLLSYLAPDKGGIRLKIALLSEDPATLVHYPFPFFLINDTDPLSRLVQAAFVTDSGSRIKDVFLLVQRDTYSFAANQLVPLTNVDVEGFWQQTYQVHCQHEGGSPLITLQQQLDHQGKLAPFQSLFFCSSTRTCFHPPCPSCGVPLQLCSNDHLLDSLGLPQYTRSLSRYLFCPTCFSSGQGTDFYTHHKNPLDPALVKDCADLIRAFGQLVRERNEGSGLPCMVCAQNEQCFGPASSSAPPIVPFSFYPFYMLIYEAMSLNGLDFLAMVAGASTEELAARLRRTGEPGRAISVESFKPGRGALRPFLFDDDARFFLEILYLKLTFLGQIVTEIFPASGKGKPDPLLYLDRIWVKLTVRAGLLPYLWNFELNYIDLVRDPLDLPAHPPMPPAYALHLLGLIWFTVLLTNSTQEVAEVQRAIERAHDRIHQNDPINLADLMAEPAFLPENVFWNPASFELAEDWHSLWGEALKIGWSLFQASSQGESSGFREELIGAIARLRANIKREMFLESAVGSVPDRSTEAEAIHGILSLLAAKWRESAVVQPEEEWEKTLVLPSDARFEETLPPGLEAAPEDTSATVILGSPGAPQPIAAAADEEIFQETVILSGKGLAERIRSDEAPARKAGEELSETVILGSPEASAGWDTTPASAPPPVSDEQPKGAGEKSEELAETVILTPSPKPEARDVTYGRSGAPAPAETAKEETLPETVILSPQRGPRTPPRVLSDQAAPGHVLEPPESPPSESEGREDAAAMKPKPGEEDDLLSATIILSPSKDRDKK